jgi:transposase InsO family protein
MPWKAKDVMRLRMEFVFRLERGERMTDLCREYEISRKTGYKIWNRFKERGWTALDDQSRRPKRLARRTPHEIEELCVKLKKKHPSWGSKKLHDILSKEHQGLRIPARSTLDDMFKRHGLTKPRRKRSKVPSYPSSLHVAEAPNEVLCVDFKGQFRLGNSSYCYPFTATDQHSRYILSCTALDDTRGVGVREAMEELFAEYGLPERIRSDNGSPFASRGIAGLSQISVWWRLLGIVHERIVPGHPEQNGRHERMHKTLKAETTRPAANNSLAQQECFDAFVEEFNEKRPHEALGMKRPAEIYEPSTRKMPGLIPEPHYPLHDDIKTVSSCGHVNMHGRKNSFFLGTALAGQLVGIREEEPNLWLVSFADLDLGHFDNTQRKFRPLDQ